MAVTFSEALNSAYDSVNSYATRINQKSRAMDTDAMNEIVYKTGIAALGALTVTLAAGISIAGSLLVSTAVMTGTFCHLVDTHKSSVKEIAVRVGVKAKDFGNNARTKFESLMGSLEKDWKDGLKDDISDFDRLFDRY